MWIIKPIIVFYTSFKVLSVLFRFYKKVGLAF